MEAARQTTLSFPFTFVQAEGIPLDAARTFQMNKLIQSLRNVVNVGDLGVAGHGLLVAKVFRNKEGHAVWREHGYDPVDYRDVEQALVGLYQRAFRESLRVHFVMEASDRFQWRVV